MMPSHERAFLRLVRLTMISLVVGGMALLVALAVAAAILVDYLGG